ncbi:MAG: hypothetical protein A2Y07_01915, partial [Planctomycetes bacterium GWF2_50_10]
ISEFLEGDYSMSELCIAYNISRKTGYKWLARYEQFGTGGLEDLSRVPHHHPHEIPDAVKSTILCVNARYPHWGPLKIEYKIRKLYPCWSRYPAVSTIGLFLKRQGLVISRKRRRCASPTQPPLTNGINPNDVWSVDFKGHFATRDSSRCNPLTINDHLSRYLICCRHVDRMSYNLVKMQFERIFRQYGLPLVIRSDNGTPFSSRGIGGLSRLSAWWIRLGIHPERIEPASPDQNGRHERMHRTLKEHTAKPPADDLNSQQQRFDDFVNEYNNERPHEALEMQTPSSLYVPSERIFPNHLPRPHYDRYMQVRRVEHHGDIQYKNRRLFLGESLEGEYVGIEEIDDDKSRVWYCDYELGTIDHQKWRIEPAKPHPLLAGVNPCPSAHNSAKALPMSSV